MRSMYWRRPTSMSTCGTAPRTAQRLPESNAMLVPFDPYGLERCVRYWHKSKRIQYADGPECPGRRSNRPALPARLVRRAGRLAADDDIAVLVDRRQLVARHRAQCRIDRAEHLLEALADQLARLAHVARQPVAIRPGGRPGRRRNGRAGPRCDPGEDPQERAYRRR